MLRYHLPHVSFCKVEISSEITAYIFAPALSQVYFWRDIYLKRIRHLKSPVKNVCFFSHLHVGIYSLLFCEITAACLDTCSQAACLSLKAPPLLRSFQEACCMHTHAETLIFMLKQAKRSQLFLKIDQIFFQHFSHP